MSTRSLIVTASDAGLTYGVNEGIRALRAAGRVSDVSLMVVAPFAREAVKRLGGDLGVQLTLNTEHELLELRPVTHAPSLFGGRGGFPLSAADAAEHADPDEVRREFRAQVERAIELGVTPRFLSSHDDVIARDLALFDAFCETAEEYQLPIRHGYDFSRAGLDAERLATARHLRFPVTTLNWSDPAADLDALLAAVRDGVNEVIVSPAASTPDVTAILADGARRVALAERLDRGDLTSAMARADVTALSWTDL